MHLLILGGSRDHLGGLEAFAERSMQAISMRRDWKMTYMPTSTAYLTLRRLPAFVHGLIRLIQYRSKRPDIVWLQYVNLPDLTYLALAKLLGLRTMVTPHLGSNWHSQSKPALRAFSGRILGFADRLALISKTQELEINLPFNVPRSHIRTFLPAAVLSAPSATDEVAPAALQLIHSGRLSEGKGTFLFVEVCQKLKEAGVSFFARIIGSANVATFERLNAMIARHDLGNEVVVLGWVAEAELVDLLRASDVLIHLSRIDSYPLIVLEAMASSTIPICMELAGARDMIETYDGHVVSAAGAVSETASYLARQDLEEVRRRGRRAAARVRADYGWDRCASALETALWSAMAGGTSS